MKRLAARVAVALLTCLIGVSTAKLWEFPGTYYVPEPAPVPQEGVSFAEAGPRSIDENKILELLRQYDEAQTNHDAAFFERVEADNFVQMNPEGRNRTRAEAIADMMTWEKNVTYRSDDIQIRFYGDAAIVTGRMTATQAVGEEGYGPLSWRWVDLFVRRDGRWQILSTTLVD